jgi:hypothetical protein
MPPINNIEVQVVSPLPVTEVQVQRTGPQGPAGADGADGPAGPNSVTSATTSDGTADLSVATITVGNAAAFNGATFTYGTGSASAHRTALGLGTGDSPTFAGVQVEESAQVKELIVRSPVNPGISILKLFASENQTPTIAASANILKLSRFASIRWTGASNNADGAADFAISRASNGVLRMTPQVLELTGTLAVTGASTLSGGATFGGTTEQAATRTALGGGATGQAIFQAATTSAAQTAAGFVTLTPAAYANLVATGTADADTIYIVQE